MRQIAYQSGQTAGGKGTTALHSSAKGSRRWRRRERASTGTDGKALFDGKGGCKGCHRVGGSGPRGAPDLTDIGLTRAASQLQRSLLEPSAGMMPINRPVRLVFKDGKRMTGRRLNEDTYTVQLMDEEGRLVDQEMRDELTEALGALMAEASTRLIAA